MKCRYKRNIKVLNIEERAGGINPTEVTSLIQWHTRIFYTITRIKAEQKNISLIVNTLPVFNIVHPIFCLRF